MKLDEWCDDCAEYDKENHSCPRFNRVIRTTLDDVRKDAYSKGIKKGLAMAKIHNQVNLCDSCLNVYPDCCADNILFGDGPGCDNICACEKYKPIKIRRNKYKCVNVFIADHDR